MLNKGVDGLMSVLQSIQVHCDGPSEYTLSVPRTLLVLRVRSICMWIKYIWDNDKLILICYRQNVFLLLLDIINDNDPYAKTPVSNPNPMINVSAVC